MTKRQTGRSDGEWWTGTHFGDKERWKGSMKVQLESLVREKTSISTACLFSLLKLRLFFRPPLVINLKIVKTHDDFDRIFKWWYIKKFYKSTEVVGQLIVWLKGYYVYHHSSYINTCVPRADNTPREANPVTGWWMKQTSVGQNGCRTSLNVRTVMIDAYPLRRQNLPTYCPRPTDNFPFSLHRKSEVILHWRLLPIYITRLIQTCKSSKNKRMIYWTSLFWLR